MSKFIIHSSIEKDDIALEMVRQVILQGKMSNDGKQYCYTTTWTDSTGGKFVVESKWNKKDTYTFYCYRNERKGE